VKKLQFAIVLLLAIKSFATPIHLFQELKVAMEEGRRFTIVSHLGTMVGYFAPTSMLYMPKKGDVLEHIVTSHLHFSSHTGTPQYEYVKYTFHADNSATVYTAAYNPSSFSVLPGGHSIQLVIGKEIEIHTD